MSFYEKYNNFSWLVGKTISEVRVSEGERSLAFLTNAGWAEYDTGADCCSETWFSDIAGFDALIGSPIISAESIELPELNDGRTRQEYDQCYGVKITTAKGICDIAYRNSSNGYYGGFAFKSDSFGEMKAADMRLITGDWAA